MEKIMLLASYCLNYPVLAKLGKTLKKPVALVFAEAGDAVAFANLISPAPIIVDAPMKVLQTQKLIRRANSQGVFMLMPEMKTTSVKFQEKMEASIGAARNNMINGEQCSTAVFFMFSKFVPDEFRDTVFEIHVGGLRSLGKIDFLNQIVPEPNELELVFDKMKDFEGEDSEERALLCAGAFLYPQIADTNAYQRVVEAVKKLCEAADCYRDANGIVELFSDLMYKLAEDGCLSPVFILPELDEEGEQKLFTGIYLKGDIFYIHERNFKSLVCGMGDGITINAMKSALLKKGILITDKGGYTTKMGYCNSKGEFKRERMMKFSISAIAGEIRPNFKDFIMEGMV